MNYYELIEKTGEELNEYLKKYITGEAEFYELFDRFEEVYGKNKETVLKIINILQKANVNPIQTANEIGKNYIRFYDNDIELFEYSLDLVIKIILPEYEENILNKFKKFGEDDNEENLFVLFLLKYDYNKYIDFVKKHCLKFKYDYQLGYKQNIFSVINDDDFFCKLFLHQVKKWFNKLIKENDIKNINLTQNVITYLKTGDNFDKLKEELIDFTGNLQNFYFNSFYRIFFNGVIFKNKELKERLYNISLTVCFEDVFQSETEFFIRDNNEIKLDKLIEFSKEKQFPVYHFIFEFAKAFHLDKNNSESNIESAYLIIFLKEYKEDCLKMIKEKGDEIAFNQLYPYLFKTYKDDCFPIFFERIQKATKDEKKVLFKLLSKRQEYSEQYKTLLNSEQSNIKKLGEKLLSTLVLK